MPEQEEAIHLPANLPPEIQSQILRNFIGQRIGLIIKDKIKDQRTYNNAIRVVGMRDSNGNFILSFSDRKNFLKRLARMFYDIAGDELVISKVDLLYTLQDKIAGQEDIEKIKNEIQHLDFPSRSITDIWDKEGRTLYPHSPEFIVDLSNKNIENLIGLPKLLETLNADGNIPEIRINLLGNNIRQVPDSILEKLKELDLYGKIYIDSLPQAELQKLKKALPKMTIIDEAPRFEEQFYIEGW